MGRSAPGIACLILVAMSSIAGCGRSRDRHGGNIDGAVANDGATAADGGGVDAATTDAATMDGARADAGTDAGQSDGGGPGDGGGRDSGAVAPPCPTAPPGSGSLCAQRWQSCAYQYCFSGGSNYLAECQDDGRWLVEDLGCGEQACGGSGLTCVNDSLCVERVGGALGYDCAANPCGSGAVTPACACGICGGSVCTVDGFTVTCNSCPSGLCP